MAQVFKVDFSKKARELRAMKKQLRAEKKEPLTNNQKIDYMLNKQANEGK